MKKVLHRASPAAATGLSITVVYDNYAHTAGLTPAWGFSCLIRGLDRTILFDTGGDGAVLLDNMKRLGLDPGSIDVVFLSHSHGDHTGGLTALLRANPNVTVCLPQTFPAAFKALLNERGVKFREVGAAAEICRSVYSTGVLDDGGIPEQSLLIATDAGTILITGCAHPGIVQIIQKSRELLEDGFLLVMGGFHLGGSSRPALAKIAAEIKALDVRRVGPCHCSGDLTRRVFAEAWGGQYEKIGVGRRIGFENASEPAATSEQ